MKSFISVFVAAIFCLACSIPVAQAAPRGGNKAQENEMALKGPRRHLSVIVLSGVAGAILGLSTLSFYGRPQDRLSNIAAGAAVGIIIGAMFTTYRAAAEPREFYGTELQPDTLQNLMSLSDQRMARSAPPTLSLSISF